MEPGQYGSACLKCPCGCTGTLILADGFKGHTTFCSSLWPEHTHSSLFLYFKFMATLRAPPVFESCIKLLEVKKSPYKTIRKKYSISPEHIHYCSGFFFFGLYFSVY